MTKTPYAPQKRTSMGATGFNGEAKRLMGACLLAMAVVCLTATLAFGQTTTWKSGSGNWNDSTKWTNGVPTSSTGALIDAGNIVASPVTLNIGGAQVLNLTIDSDDSLSFSNNTSLTINGSSISNAGNITLNSAGNLTDLCISGPVTLSGTGTFTMGNNGNNRIYAPNGTDTLTNKETIQGGGQLGVGSMGLINNGTILANQSTPLVIQPSASKFTNNGTLQVNSGDLMHVLGGPFTNFRGSTLTGGTYNVSGTLEIDQLGSSGFTTGGAFTNAGTCREPSPIGSFDGTLPPPESGEFLEQFPIQSDDSHRLGNSSGILRPVLGGL